MYGPEVPVSRLADKINIRKRVNCFVYVVLIQKG
jgi:hypothetical protein